MEGLIVYRDAIEKAKKANIGEIRVWSGKRMRKESDGTWSEIIENKKESSTLKKTKDYATRVIAGTKKINRLSLEEEKGTIKGGRINIESTILLGANEGANDETERASLQEKLLEEYAKERGCWYYDLDKNFNSENFFDKGDEAKIYHLDKKYLAKVFNYKISHDTPQEFLDRISLQNYLYPEVSYELLGFGKRDDNFMFVLKQKFKDAPFITTDEEVKNEMENSGFIEEDGLFINDDYVVEDLHSKNVIKDKENNLWFIDPIIRLNTKDEDYGGKRTFGKINIDEDNIRKAFDGKLTIYQDNIEKAKHYENIQVHRDGKTFMQKRLVGSDKIEEKKEFKQLKSLAFHFDKLGYPSLRNSFELYEKEHKNNETINKILIGAYTENLYELVNSTLRMPVGDEKEENELIDLISKQLKTLSNYNNVTYRVQNLSELQVERIKNSVGESITFKGFSSSTKKEELLKKKSTDYIFIIDSKKGYDIEGISERPEEKEVLFDKNSKFKIFKVDNNRIYLEDIK